MWISMRTVECVCQNRGREGDREEGKGKGGKEEWKGKKENGRGKENGGEKRRSISGVELQIKRQRLYYSAKNRVKCTSLSEVNEIHSSCACACSNA